MMCCRNEELDICYSYRRIQPEVMKELNTVVKDLVGMTRPHLLKLGTCFGFHYILQESSGALVTIAVESKV